MHYDRTRAVSKTGKKQRAREDRFEVRELRAGVSEWLDTQAHGQA